MIFLFRLYLKISHILNNIFINTLEICTIMLTMFVSYNHHVHTSHQILRFLFFFTLYPSSSFFITQPELRVCPTLVYGKHTKVSIIKENWLIISKKLPNSKNSSISGVLSHTPSLMHAMILSHWSWNRSCVCCPNCLEFMCAISQLILENIISLMLSLSWLSMPQ